ncbi:hypothetical protein ACWGI8_25320 [Streptomyces sp. NPDC054841]
MSRRALSRVVAPPLLSVALLLGAAGAANAFAAEPVPPTQVDAIEPTDTMTDTDEVDMAPQGPDLVHDLMSNVLSFLNGFLDGSWNGGTELPAATLPGLPGSPVLLDPWGPQDPVADPDLSEVPDVAAAAAVMETPESMADEEIPETATPPLVSAPAAPAG